MEPSSDPVSERLMAVSQRLLVDDESLVTSLQAVAEAGCGLIAPCAAASITIIDGNNPKTVASTDALAVSIDQAQYEEGDGPCLRAARTEDLVHVHTMDDATDWPRFVATAVENGVASSLSAPLILPGPQRFGGLNLYGKAPDSFDDADVQIGVAFASQASAVVTNVLGYWDALEHSKHLTVAMESRAEIEQAKGILMGQEGCSAEEAFDLLRRASQRENRKLRDVAAEIVQRTRGRKS